jgi:hypothetical protein
MDRHPKGSKPRYGSKNMSLSQPYRLKVSNSRDKPERIYDVGSRVRAALERKGLPLKEGGLPIPENGQNCEEWVEKVVAAVEEAMDQSNHPHPKIGGGVRIDESLLDRNGYVTLWQFAEGKPSEEIGSRKIFQETRTFGSRLLNFICLHGNEVEIDPEDYQYLWNRFSSDPEILYRWSLTSKSIDEIAQRIRIRPYDLLNFLQQKGFDPDKTYNPKASTRLAWFKRWRQTVRAEN